MAIAKWNKILLDTVGTNQVLTKMRTKLNKEKEHIITIDKKDIQQYLKQLTFASVSDDLNFNTEDKKKLQELAKEHSKVISNFLANLQKSAVYQGRGSVKDLGTGAIEITCNNFFAWKEIRRVPVTQFMADISAAGVSINQRTKTRGIDRHKTHYTAKEKMTEDLQFSHEDPTVAQETFKEQVLDTLDAHLEKVLEGTGYSTMELKKVVEIPLVDQLALEASLRIDRNTKTVKDTLVVRGRLVSARSNRAEGRLKDRTAISNSAKKAMRNRLLKLIGKDNPLYSGSPDMTDRAADKIIAAFRKKIKNKKVKVTARKEKKIKNVLKTKPVRRELTKTKTRPKRIDKEALTMATVGKKVRREENRRRRNNATLPALISRINESLQSIIMQNMSTGRIPGGLEFHGLGNPKAKPPIPSFHTTPRVTSMTPIGGNKKEGFDSREEAFANGVNINYTYLLYPFQTFEPGFKQGSVTRDPRKIIQTSIKDAAKLTRDKLMTTKLITFRRTASGQSKGFSKFRK